MVALTKRKMLLFCMMALVCLYANASKYAITAEGEKVVLRDDGTWAYADKSSGEKSLKDCMMSNFGFNNHQTITNLEKVDCTLKSFANEKMTSEDGTTVSFVKAPIPSDYFDYYGVITNKDNRLIGYCCINSKPTEDLYNKIIETYDSIYGSPLYTENGVSIYFFLVPINEWSVGVVLYSSHDEQLMIALMNSDSITEGFFKELKK